ncbi:SWIM zinc finger family protein [Actinomadura craniellae]|uniref:SWIM zinc finger family protein n=1 Tax=Actinomadura craniellae TaxID=2231787 RepID=A0A365GY35_9ACTN|nr:SWIM zinc finger family protein [Actinomadura craniellae]RAY11731.1 SWIM zinc finger family protein [Actinomadura craniellae]
MSDRWGRDQVLGLAPDTAAVKAATTVAKPAKWARAGCDEQAVWGECAGSGASVYRTSADLAEPAFRCTCPSRKFPCKHALGLLLLWSDGTIDPAARPAWVAEWLDARAERAGQAERSRERTAARAADPETAQRRERRVEEGLAELGRWLRDQVAQGLSGAESASYQAWDDVARRLVDAQAGAVAGRVRELASIPHGGGRAWPERLLAEYALLHLLVRAYERGDDLPPDLRATVRSRVGFTVPQEEVLAGPRVRDHWYVAGSHDTEQDRLVTRRVWLRGRATGRPALVLSFGAPGRPLEASLPVGSLIDADLAFYPGAQPLRALIAERHGPPHQGPPGGGRVLDLLDEYAAGLARDPWLDRWPALLAGVRPARADGVPHVVDDRGDALPLLGPVPWRLLAMSGGRPCTVGGEWTPAGLRPLSAWREDEGVILL